MRRRIVPGPVWLGLLLSVALLLVAHRVRAFGPHSREPDLLGTWDGFYQEAGEDGTLGLVFSDITEQFDQRIAGDALLTDLQGLVPIEAMNFRATVARNNFITGRGMTSTGHFVFDAGLETFAGGEGDAGVMHPQFLFVPPRGRASRVDSILLHPFPDVNSPDIVGSGTGTFRSEIDPTFEGDVAVEIFPRNRGSFQGHVDFMPHSFTDPPFSWQLRATTSSTGRVVMIARGRTGKLVYDGVTFPTGGDTSTFVGGFYRLLLNNGRLDFGAVNFNLSTLSP